MNYSVKEQNQRSREDGETAWGEEEGRESGRVWEEVEREGRREEVRDGELRSLYIRRGGVGRERRPTLAITQQWQGAGGRGLHGEG